MFRGISEFILDKQAGAECFYKIDDGVNSSPIIVKARHKLESKLYACRKARAEYRKAKDSLTISLLCESENFNAIQDHAAKCRRTRNTATAELRLAFDRFDVTVKSEQDRVANIQKRNGDVLITK